MSNYIYNGGGVKVYEKFQMLLDKTNKTAYQVAKETGVSTATLSNWKNGNYIPKTDKLKKIADYFGITVDELISEETGDDTPRVHLTVQKITEDEEGIDWELYILLNFFRDSQKAVMDARVASWVDFREDLDRELSAREMFFTAMPLLEEIRDESAEIVFCTSDVV